MLRLPRAERLLAWAAAGVGLIGLVSALTPEMADRVRIVGGLLPPGWPEAARVFTVACGIGLIWLSRSLAKRRRRAWQLAVVVVLASAVAHLAKGLDFEEAAISLLLLAALVRWRRRFDVPGDPASVRPLLGLGAALAGIAAVAVSEELRGPELPHRAADALTGIGIAVGVTALYYWLRPFGQAVAQTVGERRAARAVVEAYGRDSLAFFALRRDKSYLFSPSRRAFLAYRVVAGTALVSGDPVGDDAEIDGLLAELQRLVRARGWRLAVVGASGEQLDRYRGLGLKPVPIGEEAVLRPQEFSLEGRAIRKVRQSVSRLRKAGYSFRLVAADEIGPELAAELADVSASWRGGARSDRDQQRSPEHPGFVLQAAVLRRGGFHRRSRRQVDDLHALRQHELERVIAHHSVVIGVVIDPSHGLADTNGDGEGGEPIFVGHNNLHSRSATLGGVLAIGV